MPSKKSKSKSNNQPPKTSKSISTSTDGLIDDLDIQNVSDMNNKELFLMIKSLLANHASNIQASFKAQLDASQNNIESKMSAELKELSTSLESFKQTMSGFDASIKQIQKTTVSLEGDMLKLKTELNELEQYGRRWLVRVHGVPEAPQENCAEVFKQLLRNKFNINLSKEDVEAAHRVGRKFPDRPQAIIVRFTRRDTKQQILSARRQLKGSGISISEDLTQTNAQLLNRLKNSELIEASWSSNGKIFGVVKATKKKMVFKPFISIEDTISAN
jgi:septal ring factor EnvC (AmiA/AmiB activator)